MIFIGSLNDCFTDISKPNLLVFITSRLYKNTMRTTCVTPVICHILIFYKINDSVKI